MSDTSLSGAYQLLHHAYAEAVALVDGPSGPYEPDEWAASISEDGVLFATFYYRRAEEEVPFPSVATGQPWPFGVAVRWNETDGWGWTPLLDQWSRTGNRWESLPVDTLASPAAVRAVLVLLLAGREEDLRASTERWTEPRAAALAEHLAAHHRAG
ncbi:hypothetical protein AB0B12_42040 [Streptomyces sp. NPDC044780]|uniref:hypothetical protein n=1 Tax=unclassified Streptomyces TaxID=2593676 RepID=UPI0033E8061E